MKAHIQFSTLDRYQHLFSSLVLSAGCLIWMAQGMAQNPVGNSWFKNNVNSVTLIGCSSEAGTQMARLDPSDRSRIEGLGVMVTIEGFDPGFVRAVKEDCSELREKFDVDSPMVFLVEEGSPNAYATQETMEDWIQDGTVLLGTKLSMKEFRYNNGYGIPTVLGHEFAHILQHKRGFPRLNTTKWQELHADFMSGWFTAHRSRFRPHVPVASWSSVYNKGDYAFNSPDHHGTPAERTASFEAGFRLNTEDNISTASVAYAEGIKYIKLRGAPIE